MLLVTLVKVHCQLYSLFISDRHCFQVLIFLYLICNSVWKPEDNSQEPVLSATQLSGVNSGCEWWQVTLPAKASHDSYSLLICVHLCGGQKLMLISYIIVFPIFFYSVFQTCMGVVHMHVYTHVPTVLRARTVNRIAWAGVSGGCELPDVGSGNHLLVFCKSSKNFQLLSHLFASMNLFFKDS